MEKPRVICLDDTNRPKEIKPSLWVKKDNFYTITHIYYHPKQQIQGVELAEVELDDSCYPYVSFALKRFGILAEDLERGNRLIIHITKSRYCLDLLLFVCLTILLFFYGFVLLIILVILRIF